MDRILTFIPFVNLALGKHKWKEGLNMPGLLVGLLVALGMLMTACADQAGQTLSPERVSADGVAVITATPVPVLEPDSRVTAGAEHDNDGDDDNKGGVTLVILHTNDGESQLVNLGSGMEEFGGAARFASVVEREKKLAMSGNDDDTKNVVLVVSAGDNSLAGPEYAAGLDVGVFYDALAMDLIGFDAITIGNHEFDFGPDALVGFINEFKRSKSTFITSNLDFSGEPALQRLFDEGRIAESVVIKKHGTRIGLIGLTTPDLPERSSPRNVVASRDLAGEVRAEVNKLQAEGVNKIVLVSHLREITDEIGLVAELDGIDVVVAGGGAELLANPGDLLLPGDETPFGPYPVIASDIDGTQVPIVTTSGEYGYLGKLVVEFDGEGNLVEVDQDASGVLRVAGGDQPDAVEPDQQIQKKVVEPVVEFIDGLAGNIIATSEVDLEGRRSEVRSRETNQGNLMADSQLWQAGQLAPSFGVGAPNVALQNGGGIRNDSILPAGPISELNTFEMAPFPNFVTVLEEVSRQQFKDALENAVSRAVAGDASGGTGRFGQIAGFSFEWSESGDARVLNADGTVAVSGTRVQKVTLDDGTLIVDGGTVMPGPALTVATNDFLARGGDEYPFQGAPFTILGVTYQLALANYIQDGAGLNGTITAADYPVGGEGRITRLP